MLEEARLTLAAALERIKHNPPELTDKQPLAGINLEDWLIFQTLRPEAEGPILGNAD